MIDFKIKHVILDLKVDLQHPKVTGSAELILYPYFFDQEILILDAKNLTIEKITIQNQDWGLYEYNSTQLIIELPRVFQKGEQLIVRIDYAIDQFSVPAQAKALNEGGIFVIDYWEGTPSQLWTQGETQFSSKWYPTIDQPNQKYTQTTHLTVLDSLTTLSNGQLIAQQQMANGWRKDTWKLDLPHAPYLSMIAVGNFQKSRLSNVEGFVWSSDSNIDIVAKAFNRTGQMIDFFENRLGVKYPWPVYNQIIAKDYISGAMENTGAVVFLEDILMDSQEQSIRHFDDYISHELAHHWFGNLVTCESWANLALNESFATYAEQLWNEFYYGSDSAELIAFRELNMYLNESLQKKEDLIRYYYESADRDLFDSHSYAKGSRILHMLRLYVGDDAFFESVNYYLNKNQYQTVEIHDLRKAFEHVTGLDLNWFFQQWMLNPGHPELEIQHFLRDDTLYVEVSQVQDLLEQPVYYLPLYADVYWNDETRTYPFTIENQRHVFRIPVSGRMFNAIVIDPNYQLVGTINHDKTKTELSNQAIMATDLMARYEAYLKLLNDSTASELPSSVVQAMLKESNEMLLVELLDRLIEFENFDGTEFATQIQKLTTHQHPQVKASALLLQSEFYQVDWKSVFENEESTYIKGLALEQLIATADRFQKMQWIDSLRMSEDLNILLPLTFAINDEYDEGFDLWYQQKIKSQKSPNQFYLIAGYNEYLLDAPQDEKLSAISFLKTFAKYHIDESTRMAAFEGLILLSDAVSVSVALDEIIAFERNEQLLALYRRFYP